LRFIDKFGLPLHTDATQTIFQIIKLKILARNNFFSSSY